MSIEVIHYAAYISVIGYRSHLFALTAWIIAMLFVAYFLFI